MKKIGFALTCSYCTIDQILPYIKELVERGFDVYPIASPNLFKLDTRFGKGEDFKNIIESYTSKSVITTIEEAEVFGPKVKLDLLIVAPTTGNLISKLANATTDNTVSMAIKATLRNSKPILLHIATNDGLGANLKNIGELIVRKNFYFVPFGQDDYENKPYSLASHSHLIPESVDLALEGKQNQPILVSYQKIKRFNPNQKN